VESNSLRKSLATGLMYLTVLSAGSPFSFIVVDPDKVNASGNGLDLVRVNKLATFAIKAPAGRISDFSITITGTVERCKCFITVDI